MDAAAAAVLAFALTACASFYLSGGTPPGVAADSPLAGLPLIEVHADAPPAVAPDTSLFPPPPGADSTFAVLLSGDGGWAGTDRSLANRLARAGLPVVGWNSLRYYWKARTPAEAAADLGRVIEHYEKAWDRPRVFLVGYSFGADVLPILYDRLSPEQRAGVRAIALLSFADDALFEFHMVGWLGIDKGRLYPTLPAVDRIRDVPVTCVYGARDPNAACSRLDQPNVRVYRFGGGHHFGLENDEVAAAVLSSLR